LEVGITDDGIGMESAGPVGRGLGNIRRRAEELGGSADFGTSPGGGTTVRWAVPLPRI